MAVDLSQYSTGQLEQMLVQLKGPVGGGAPAPAAPSVEDVQRHWQGVSGQRLDPSRIAIGPQGAVRVADGQGGFFELKPGEITPGPNPAVPGSAAGAPPAGSSSGSSRSKVPLVPVRASEFGEVDRPSRGGYTERNWNLGKWGADLTGESNRGVALPRHVLMQFGDPDSAEFANRFNTNFDVQVIDPKSGKAVVAPLKDEGPGRSTGKGIDFLWGTARDLGLGSRSDERVHYRITQKGTGLPEGTVEVTSGPQGTSVNVGGVGDGAGAAYAGLSGNTIQMPGDLSKLKQPTGHGELSADEIAQAARGRALQYAVAMQDAGTRLSVGQYKKLVMSMYDQVSAENKAHLPKPIPGDQLTTLSALANNFDLLDHMQQLHAKAVDSKAPGFGSWPAAGMPGLSPFAQGLSQEGTAFNTAYEASLAQIARGLGGQTGVLTDKDLELVRKWLPNPGDSKETAATKVQVLKEQTTSMLQRKVDFYKAANYDVTELSAMQKVLGVNQSGQQQKIQGNGGVGQKDPAQRISMYETTKDKLDALVRQDEATPAGGGSAAPSPWASGAPSAPGGGPQAQPPVARVPGYGGAASPSPVPAPPPAARRVPGLRGSPVSQNNALNPLAALFAYDWRQTPRIS